jgi:colanic acid/amylovoran biosynthesis glycosyltransferase
MISKYTFESMPIAYISQVFPSLTTTFIYREVSALENIGFDITTLSIWKPDVNILSAESKELVDRTVYVFPISWLPFFAAHFYFLFTHPLQYVGTLLFVLTRRGETKRNRLRSFFHFGEAIFLAAEVKKRGIQHVHAHFSINAASIALVISRMLGISFSFTAHNIFFTDRLLLEEKCKAARFVVAISEYSRDYLLQLVPKQNRDKFHVVHCGVSIDQYSPPASKRCNPSWLIFSISQLVERKGLDILVQACRILNERGHDFQCIIAGDGPQRSLLEQMITEYNLCDQVQLVGTVFQEQLSSYLNQADVFVLPCVTVNTGEQDGIPVVLMEAMAMELPTVSTYVSGIPELIQDGASGLLVPERDPEALVDAMQQLLRDRGLGARLGKNARQQVLREFDINENARRLAGLFGRYLKADEDTGPGV